MKDFNLEFSGDKGIWQFKNISQKMEKNVVDDINHTTNKKSRFANVELMGDQKEETFTNLPAANLQDKTYQKDLLKAKHQSTVNLKRGIQLQRLAFSNKKNGLLIFTLFILAILYAVSTATFTFVPGYVTLSLLSQDPVYFWQVWGVMGVVFFVASVLGGLLMFTVSYFGISVRQKITTELHKRYMSFKAYYRLLWETKEIDNPDQRICQDVKSYSDGIATLLFGYSNQTATGIFTSFFGAVALIALSLFNGEIPIWGAMLAILVILIPHVISTIICTVFISRFTYSQAILEGDYRQFFVHSFMVKFF